jgi:hypothetical protein
MYLGEEKAQVNIEIAKPNSTSFSDEVVAQTMQKVRVTFLS